MTIVKGPLKFNGQTFFKVRFKNAIHYISHSLFLKDWKLFSRSPKPLLTFLVFPIGVALHLYVFFKTRDM